LKRIQEVMVEEQVNDHVAQRRSCPDCGGARHGNKAQR
jgi:hypothetical protein